MLKNSVTSTLKSSQCGKVVQKAITIFTEKRYFFRQINSKNETFVNLLYKTLMGKCK